MSANDDINAAALAQLAEVKGQLTNITQLLQANYDATNTRINDLREAHAKRMDGHEKRIGTLEGNERGTAIRTAGVAALTSAIVAAGIAAAKAWR